MLYQLNVSVSQQLNEKYLMLEKKNLSLKLTFKKIKIYGFDLEITKKTANFK